MGGGTDGASYNVDGSSNLLTVNADDSESWLNANWDNPDNQWNSQNGFVFAVPQLTKFQTLPLKGVFVSIR